MAKRYNSSENTLIEKAITFLIDEYRNSGTNPKPVVFHSLRVACKLTQYDADATVVATAILHDLIEDSDVTVEKISAEFGSEISSIVLAVSFKPSISDKIQQYKEMFERVIESGRSAMEIKCVDILDNSDYYGFGNNEPAERILLQKLEYFLSVTESGLNDFPAYKELADRFNKLSKEFIDEYKEK